MLYYEAERQRTAATAADIEAILWQTRDHMLVHAWCLHCQVVRVAVDPTVCALDAPFRIEIDLRSKVPLPKVQWQVKFLADLVHHQVAVLLPVDRIKESAEDAEDGASSRSVELFVSGVPPDALPASALESLGLLEVRLADSADSALKDSESQELCSLRLVVDVRRVGPGLWQRGVLDPLR